MSMIIIIIIFRFCPALSGGSSDVIRIAMRHGHNVQWNAPKRKHRLQIDVLYEGNAMVLLRLATQSVDSKSPRILQSSFIGMLWPVIEFIGENIRND